MSVERSTTFAESVCGNLKSLFESIIPEDYYATVSNFYDTVMFVMDLDLKASYDQFGEMKYIGDSNLNGIYPYLRENRKLITRTDVKMRSKLSGTYTPLADIPGIGDQLPMELPMLLSNQLLFSYQVYVFSP